MATYDSQIAKMGVTISDIVAFESFPNWASAVNQSAGFGGAGQATALLNKVIGKASGWLTAINGAKSVRSREFFHMLGRYPSRQDDYEYCVTKEGGDRNDITRCYTRRTPEKWRYLIRHDMGGRSSVAYVKMLAQGPRRGGPAGPDRGAMSGEIRAIVTIKPVGSAAYVAYNQIVASYMNSWTDSTAKSWEATFSNPAGIEWIEVRLDTDHGSELRDAVEHGNSQPWSWNPGGPLMHSAVRVGLNFNAILFPVRVYTGVDLKIDREARYDGAVPSQITYRNPDAVTPKSTSYFQY